MEKEVQIEIKRLKEIFEDSDEKKLSVLDALIIQAAHEKVYLDRLNEQAKQSGLVMTKEGKPHVQKTLPVSNEIVKHTASLTNVMDKIMKHLGAQEKEEDSGLDEYQ